MYCKKCSSSLNPIVEMLISEDLYYHGGARCRTCNYLYFPDFPRTWNAEAWIADFDQKAEVILNRAYADKQDWRREVYLVLHFLDCLDDKMVTWYISSPEFNEHQRIAEVMRSLGANKSVGTLERVVQIAAQHELTMGKFEVVGYASEFEDDAWEETTFQLSKSLDSNLCKLVYDRFMFDHDISEFAEG